MKGKLAVLVVTAVTATLLGGTSLCQASTGSREPQRLVRAEPALPGDFPKEIERALALNEAQKGQIRAILSEEREQALSLHEKETELRQQLRLAERAAVFNEQAVRKTAAALGALETERIVARTRRHYRIGTVLTPAQRALAEQLRPMGPERGERAGRPAPPCGCEGERSRHPGPADDQDGR